MNYRSTWFKLINKALEIENDGPLIACTLTEKELHKSFYTGYGGEEGKSFTAWTENRVYFPACYDGAEWVASVPRNPCDEATGHVGG
jgi:hypothetical protein